MEKSTIKSALRYAFRQLVFVYSKWLLLVLFIVYALSGIYKIDRDTVAVLTRFGKVVNGSVQPGLHYKLPWPIDSVVLLPVRQVRTLVINDFGSRYRLKEGGASYDFYKKTNLDPYCITGDNNIVAITLDLEYTIDNPVNYLYGTRNPESLVERTAAGLIIHHLASLKIDDVLTVGKKQIEFELQQTLINTLEPFDTGIRISFLEIKEVTPPKKVQEAFDRVINAEVEKKQALNEAQGYFNRIVPEARTAANRMIREAEAYKREKILRAEGEASQFLSRYEAYRGNTEAHRKKMYLEFMSSLYPRIGEVRVIKSEEAKDNQNYSHVITF